MGRFSTLLQLANFQLRPSPFLLDSDRDASRSGSLRYRSSPRPGPPPPVFIPFTSRRVPTNRRMEKCGFGLAPLTGLDDSFDVREVCTLEASSLRRHALCMTLLERLILSPQTAT